VRDGSSGATPLASVASPTVADLVERMLTQSTTTSRVISAS
jgi:hypothetical protein